MDQRLRILLDQLNSAWYPLEGRLTGRRMAGGQYEGEPGVLDTTLTHEEFFWEPVPSCWSLCRRGDARSSSPYGAGKWLLDSGEYASNPRPSPLSPGGCATSLSLP